MIYGVNSISETRFKEINIFSDNINSTYNISFTSSNAILCMEYFFYSLTFIVMIPFIIASIFLFGDFDTGGGLFPSSDIVIYLIGSVFWFVISCEIANQWDRLFFG